MLQSLQSRPREAPPLETLRLILFALIAGLVLFAISVYFLSASSRSISPSSDDRVNNTAEAANLLVLVGAGMLVMGLAVALVLRFKAIGMLASSKDEALTLIRADRVPPSLSGAIIAGAAIVEGPGLMGAVARILGAPDYALALPIVAATLIAGMIPSRESLEQSLL